ncbi:MAG TPA: DpnII family type II restriction endonuclease [Flavilitoribacter sp.]|nr:DpnII family type II restriction endonuclease [Flavilitoribacter sp.]
MAKADFAIPEKGNPNVVIEVKAYGATGSKQTDSLGDVEKIISNKRHDTYFLFITDGITWLDRLSDLKKIIKYQNEGFIYRVYTMNMKNELIDDLIKIKQEAIL